MVWTEPWVEDVGSITFTDQLDKIQSWKPSKVLLSSSDGAKNETSDSKDF